MSRSSAEYLRISMALSDLDKLEEKFAGVPMAEEHILEYVKKAKDYLEDRRVLVSSFTVGNRREGKS